MEFWLEGGRVRFGREREGLGLGGRGRVRFGSGVLAVRLVPSQRSKSVVHNQLDHKVSYSDVDVLTAKRENNYNILCARVISFS